MPRRGARTAVVAAVGAGVVAFAALGGPHAISHAWHDFKNPTAGLQGGANQTAARFSSTSGNGRYQYWSSAGQAWSKHRLAGIGAGSWELWWDRHADLGGHVVNAHSLYMETLAETGLVGLALLAAFLALLLAVAIRRARAGDAGAAGAAGAIAAFCVAGAVDWVWQLPAIPVAALLLGGAMLARDTAAPRGRSRLALGVLAVVALAVIVVPMAATAALRRSQQDARASRLGPALQQALSAGQVQPYAASPLLQRALILEQAGDLAQAARVAQTAERKEPTNWEPAFVRARIESERGNVGAALAAFRRARTLNRTSNLLGSTR